MKRLTQRNEYGDCSLIHRIQELGLEHCAGEICEVLAEYEDIKLTPREINSLLHDGVMNMVMRNRALREENTELKATLEKSVELPVALGKECYIIKAAETTTIEKAVVKFPVLFTENENGNQIMSFRNVCKTREQAENALKEREVL